MADEGLEQAAEHGLGDARAVIGDANLQVLAVASKPDVDLAGIGGNRFARVQQTACADRRPAAFRATHGQA